MVEPLRHRQTKGAATDMFYLTSPRHISTLPFPDLSARNRDVRFAPLNRRRQFEGLRPKSAKQSSHNATFWDSPRLAGNDGTSSRRDDNRSRNSR